MENRFVWPSALAVLPRMLGTGILLTYKYKYVFFQKYNFAIELPQKSQKVCTHFIVCGSSEQEHLSDTDDTMTPYSTNKFILKDQKWTNMAVLSTFGSGPKGSKMPPNGQFFSLSQKITIFVPPGLCY